MTVSLKHAFTSNVADSGDTTLVQPSNWNAEHTLTAAANTLLGSVAGGAVTEVTCTAAGRALLDDADAAAQRTTLGLGTIATQNSNNVSITGGSIGSLTALAIGGAASSFVDLSISQNITGATVAYSTLAQGNVLSDVTVRATGFHTALGTQATAFTLNNLSHFFVQQLTFGAGSTVNTQIGFVSDGGLIGATANYGFVAGDSAAVTAGKGAYGFFSSINTATGGGTAWAFYGNGTAPSYFAGSIGLGTTTVPAQLNVVGVGQTLAALSTSGNLGGSIYLGDSGLAANNGGAIVFGAASTAWRFAMIKSMVQNGADNSIGDIGFFVRSVGTDATLTEAIRIKYTGNVGVGTSAPDAKLSVNGIASFGAGAAATPSVTAFGDLDTGMWFPAANTLAFSTGGTERLRIRSDGNIGIGNTGTNSISVYLTSPLTGTASPASLVLGGTIQSDATSIPQYLSMSLSTAAGSYTIGNAQMVRMVQGSIGAGSSITNLWGCLVADLLAGTTNYHFQSRVTAESVTTGKTAYSFYTSGNVASGGGVYWAFYGAGTANSYFGGNVGIGSTTLTNVGLRLARPITGATTAYGIYIDSTIQSDVTAAANIIQTNALTAAASFTVSNLTHFLANQGALGASSAVTAQSGFSGAGTLIGATTNYAFFAGNTAAITAGKTAYGFYSSINVASGGGTTWAFYGAGTAWSYFGGPVIFDDEIWVDAPAPTTKSTTATLTAAELRTSIINTTGTTYTVTLPTGTDIDAGFSGIPATVNIGFDFSVVNTASGTITIAVNTGVTSLGTLTIATGVSAIFRLRRTAANTYVVYRLA